MKKQEFFEQLTKKLTALGIPSEVTRKNIGSLESFFAGLSPEEEEKRIDDIGDINDFAVKVYDIIKKKSKDSETKTRAIDRIENGDAEMPSENPQDKGEIAENNDIPWPTDDGFLFEDDDVKTADDVPDIEDSGISVRRDGIAKDRENIACERVGEERPPKPKKPKIVRSPEEEEKIRHNKKVFYTILAVSSPVWIFALLLVALLYGFAFFVTGLVAAASVIGMVGVVIAGTALALFGIIYGITQMGVKPVGLYEIGLGIAIAAVTMILGILLYNFALRIMPYAFKWLIAFTKNSYEKMKELFFRIRKECIGE